MVQLVLYILRIRNHMSKLLPLLVVVIPERLLVVLLEVLLEVQHNLVHKILLIHKFLLTLRMYKLH